MRLEGVAPFGPPAFILVARGGEATLLLPRDELNRIWVLRKVLNPLSAVEAMELLLDKMKKTPSNADFLASLPR